ncbi:hypothetical protein [Anatilimnocola floriformis]|uniref:hypothetical protein n=1 Tax=Anatilimnocola floriformis TaxID=2948575 RepID=UPI0020C3B191|nr:hypothetical protein [Anatilimnocola floriformis]
MHFYISLAFFCLTAVAIADEKSPVPATAKTSTELRKTIQETSPKLLSPERIPVDFAEFNRTGRSVFLAWYCPTSGEATCRVFSYEFNETKKEWKLLREQFFRGTQDISPEFTLDLRLRFRDVRGKEIFYEPEPK